MGSIAQFEDEKKELAKDIHILERLTSQIKSKVVVSSK